MANKTIVIDDKPLGVFFQHAHMGQLDDDVGMEKYDEVRLRIENALNEAFKAGQIRAHSTMGLPDISVEGVTVCFLEDEDRNIVSTGYAFCSVNDQFNKERGRNVSLSRAIEWVNRDA